MPDLIFHCWHRLLAFQLAFQNVSALQFVLSLAFRPAFELHSLSNCVHIRLGNLSTFLCVFADCCAIFSDGYVFRLYFMAHSTRRRVSSISTLEANRISVSKLRLKQDAHNLLYSK